MNATLNTNGYKASNGDMQPLALDLSPHLSRALATRGGGNPIAVSESSSTFCSGVRLLLGSTRRNEAGGGGCTSGNGATTGELPYGGSGLGTPMGGSTGIPNPGRPNLDGAAVLGTKFIPSCTKTWAGGRVTVL